ncbi:urocortin 3, like [Electrophorus electricus]|nr:urocortin 3, like [Electrophorus electricus]XP_026884885.1 urocortin 3, like [Electrophorus electricus]
MPFAKTLLVLAVLCAPISSLYYFVCDDEFLPRSEADEHPAKPLYDTLSLLYKPADALSSQESRERRTLPESNYKFLSQTLLRSKMYRNSAKSERRNQVTLSLDVPTSIMNILFDIAKAKNLRAKAAHNARLLAQIGRRK